MSEFQLIGKNVKEASKITDGGDHGEMKMPGDEWFFAIDDKDLNEDLLEVVFPKGIPIMLVRKEGKIYAMSNKCAHMACGLESGNLDGFTLTCPCHDWKYDIRTGKFLTAEEIKIPTYESRLSDGKILIKI